MKRIAALLVLGLAAAVLPATPSSAGVGRGSFITVQSSNATVWPGNCKFSGYNVSVPDGYADWEAEVTVVAPNGTTSDEDWLTADSPRGRTLLCAGEDRPGRYDVFVDWTAYDENFNEVASDGAVAPFVFTVRKKKPTRLTVKVQHVRHGFWKMTTKLTKAGKPFARQRVSMQANVGFWGNLKTKTTNRAGVIRWTARPEAGARRYPIRAYYAGTNRVKSAASRTFRIYP